MALVELWRRRDDGTPFIVTTVDGASLIAPRARPEDTSPISRDVLAAGYTFLGVRSS